MSPLPNVHGLNPTNVSSKGETDLTDVMKQRISRQEINLALSKVKSLSRARLFATPRIVACTKLLHPRDFPGKSTGVGCHFLLQGIFPTQGSNPGLSHCRQTLYRLSHQYNGKVLIRGRPMGQAT